MKTFKALYIDNGVIKAGEFPVEPELCANINSYNHILNLCECEEKICNYSIELERARANAVECEDQEEVKEIIAYELFNGPVVDVPLSRYNEHIISFPSGWDYRVEKVRACTDACGCDGPCIVRAVAILYRTDEQTKIEELRKKLDAFLATQTKEQLEKWLEMDRERMKQPEPEESQEEIWRKFFLELIKGGDISYLSIIEGTLIKKAAEKYTITRKP